jgi:universal stress protein A
MNALMAILHPTDFSAAARPAFDHALAAAKRDDATLILVHVIEPVSALADETYIARQTAAEQAEEAAARKGFDALLAQAKDAGVPARDLLVFGWPPEEIVKAATAESAELIVMGTHGRTGLRRLMLGSVAQQVIALAPCPVVTVRMR